MRKLLAVAITISIIILAGCSCIKTKKTEVPVASINQNNPANLWSIEDNRMVAAKFVDEALNADWLQAFEDQYKRKPVVIVRSVVNMTEEHLPIDGFVRDLSRELLKSGKVRLVTLREDHLENTDESLREKGDPGIDAGADFAFKGLIELTGNLEPGARSKLYRAELLLINLQKGEPIWKTETQVQKQNTTN